MRTTKNQLTKKQAVYVGEVTNEKHEAVNPETKDKVSVDFSKDLFSLVDTLTPHKVIKDYFEICDEVEDGYVKRRLTDYNKVIDHYSAIKRFLSEFSHTRLYQHLQSLNNPEKALEILLDMFSPPPKAPKKEKQEGQGQKGEGDNKQEGEGEEKKDGEKSKGKGDSSNEEKDKDENKDKEENEEEGEGEKEENEEEGEGEGKEKENKSNSGNDKGQKGGGSSNQSKDGESSDGSPDQQKPDTQNQPEEMDEEPENELSNNPPAPGIDLEKFTNDIEDIEDALEKDVMGDDILRNLVANDAGTDHNKLKNIEGLGKNIKAVSSFINSSDFEILDVARKLGITEQYQREEDVADVVYPEKDWRTTNLKSMSDLPNVLPYQYLYPDAIFDKMLFDRDLKVKQFQSRRKKKQVLYMLIDGSGSMTRTRQVIACGIAIAYVKKAIEEGSTYFFRFFDTHSFDLHKVTNKDEAIKEIDYLMKNPHSGGGTNINRAIQGAITDINDPKLFKQIVKDKDENLYDRADILVITDGEDGVGITPEFLKENRVTLHSFLLDNDNAGLQKISTTYQKLTNSDMAKLKNKI